MVSACRGTILRTISPKNLPNIVTWSDLGVKSLYYPGNYAKIALLNVNSAFTLFNGPPRASPGSTNSTTAQLAEDLSWARGRHQIGLGVNYIHAITNCLSGTTAAGEFAFNSQNTGLALGDFLMCSQNPCCRMHIGYRSATVPNHKFVKVVIVTKKNRMMSNTGA